MPRFISFMHTERQFLDGSKTVTRRKGWANLKAGQILEACEKCQGLKKGEKLNRLGLLRVVDVRRESLKAITHDECIREGFPDYTPSQFVQFYCRQFKCTDDFVITRSEFERIESA